MTDAIEAGIGGGQGSVGGVGLEPVILVVVTSLPVNAVSPGNLLISLANTQSFHAPHLLDGLVLERGSREAFLVHAVDNSKSLVFVGVKTGLPQQASGTERPAGAVGVKADNF